MKRRFLQLVLFGITTVAGIASDDVVRGGISTMGDFAPSSPSTWDRLRAAASDWYETGGGYCPVRFVIVAVTFSIAGICIYRRVRRQMRVKT